MAPMHVNSRTCPSCEAIATELKSATLLTFYQNFRSENLDAHISCCYRGYTQQEADFLSGASRAHFGESPHNFGLAIDWFQLSVNGHALFSASWYKSVLAPAAAAGGLVWGGNFPTSAHLNDSPHVEVSGWKDLV